MNRHRTADRLAALAGLLALVASAAGLALPGLYRDVPFWAQQARGTDVATLALAVPCLAVGLWLDHRRCAPGRPLVTAILLYLVYNYAIFSFSIAMNPLTPIYIAVLGLAVYALGLSLITSDPEGPDSGIPNPRRAGLAAGTLGAVAGLFGLMWLGQVAGATLSGELPADLVRANLPTNPVYALDLGVFLPLCLVAAVGLVRGRGRAAAFAIPMLIWLSLTSAGIVAGFAFAASAGDAVPVPVAVGVAAIGLVTALVALTGLGPTGRALDERAAPKRSLRAAS